MNDEIVERVLNGDDEDAGGETGIDGIPPEIAVLPLLLLLLLLVWRGDIGMAVTLEVLNLDVIWIVAWAVMICGGASAAVALSVYSAPRFGLVALPVGLGLAIVDVFVVLPRAVFFVAEEFVQPMGLAAYPDFLPDLLILSGATALAGPIALLALGFMLQGVSAGLPRGGSKEDRTDG